MTTIETLSKHYDYDLFYLKKHAIEQFFAMAPASTVKAFHLTAGCLDKKFNHYFLEAFKAKKSYVFKTPDQPHELLAHCSQVEQDSFWSNFIYFCSFASESGYQCAKHGKIDYAC